MPTIMKIRPVGAGSRAVPCAQTDMTNVIVASCNFLKIPKRSLKKLLHILLIMIKLILNMLQN